MLSVLAGFMIAMGGMINLTLGGIAGALFFSLGLATIVTFKYELFTGKAGLLVEKKITPWNLARIWFGNFIGASICAGLTMCIPQGAMMIEKASLIVATRSEQSLLVNAILGFYCGMLMTFAVRGFQETKSYIFTTVPVAFFILAGFNHCVADMFYTVLGAESWADYIHLIPTTIGNIVGCNIVGLMLRKQH